MEAEPSGVVEAEAFRVSRRVGQPGRIPNIPSLREASAWEGLVYNTLGGCDGCEHRKHALGFRGSPNPAGALPGLWAQQVALGHSPPRLQLHGPWRGCVSRMQGKMLERQGPSVAPLAKAHPEMLQVAAWGPGPTPVPCVPAMWKCCSAFLDSYLQPDPARAICGHLEREPAGRRS